MLHFEHIFKHWLYYMLTANKIPPDVQAYCFNLYCLPRYKDEGIFGIELIGAPQFLAQNPDWACVETWVPEPRGIHIPLSFSTDDWDLCLEKMHQLIKEFLLSEHEASKLLKKSDAVAIGFVDGDLHLIWTNT